MKGGCTTRTRQTIYYVREDSLLSRIILILAWIGFITGLALIIQLFIQDSILKTVSWRGETYVRAYGIAVVTAVLFLYIRARHYSRREETLHALGYSFIDTLSLFGILGIIQYGFLLPFFDPARITRLKAVSVGFTEIAIASLILIAIGPTVHALRRRAESRTLDLNISLMHLQKTSQDLINTLNTLTLKIEALSSRIGSADYNEIRQELLKISHRVEELRNSIPATRYTAVKPPVADITQIKPETIQHIHKHEEELASINVAAAKGQSSKAIHDETNLPEAAIDNPWEKILSARKHRN